MSEVEDARIGLSVAINASKWVGKWAMESANAAGHDPAPYVEEAKRLNREEQDRCRAILFEHSGGGSIWYPQNPSPKRGP